MEKEGGNRERMRKCRESISLHFLIFSPFPPHFLILSPFPLRFLFISSFSLHFLAARLQGCNDSCSPARRLFNSFFFGTSTSLNQTKPFTGKIILSRSFPSFGPLLATHMPGKRCKTLVFWAGSLLFDRFGLHTLHTMLPLYKHQS